MGITDFFSALKIKRAEQGEKFQFAISGMHCASCSMAIDDALEELPGITRASTQYAKSETTVWADANKVSVEQMLRVIKNAGYEAKQK